jgi:hypothetical protein
VIAATLVPTPVPTTEGAVAGPAPEASVCGACPHLLAAHDVIGERYCRATLAGALTRGCACGVP